MLRPGDRELVRQIDERLVLSHGRNRKLPGIQNAGRREAFLQQVVESIRRVTYVSRVREMEIGPRRADPNDELFDPLKAAILFQRMGQIDEAFWMVFLFVHFGKHRISGWRYASSVYGRLGSRFRWDWATTSTDPGGFREWLHTHKDQIRSSGVSGGFGNHRKYENLDAYSSRGTGAAFQTYVEWVGPSRTHQNVIEQVFGEHKYSPRKAFRSLYRSMSSIARFGRTARFDYLAMLGKLGLAQIEPDSAYLQGSSGPLKGARLLFEVQESPLQIDQWLVELEVQLGVGMQVLEDALCNWQKNPDVFIPFRG